MEKRCPKSFLSSQPPGAEPLEDSSLLGLHFRPEAVVPLGLHYYPLLKAKVRTNTLSSLWGEVTATTRDSAPLVMLIITVCGALEYCLVATLAPTGPFMRKTKWHPFLLEEARKSMPIWLDKSKRCPFLWTETGHRDSCLTCCLEQVLLSSAQTVQLSVTFQIAFSYTISFNAYTVPWGGETTLSPVLQLKTRELREAEYVAQSHTAGRAGISI